jgi:hypothetical protein
MGRTIFTRTAEQAARWQEAADRDGVKLAEWIRLTLDLALDREAEMTPARPFLLPAVEAVVNDLSVPGLEVTLAEASPIRTYLLDQIEERKRQERTVPLVSPPVEFRGPDPKPQPRKKQRGGR